MLPWIDALRGLAILMVLANHVALTVPGLSAPVQALARFGQMGVQLFFVASAYTLCLSWQQRRIDEPQLVLRFLWRRLFRIAPLYWFGIALFTGLHWLQTPEASVHAYTADNLLANAVFIHAFLPAAQNSVVPGGWSIGAEMSFYVAFPLLMALLARRPGVATSLAATAAALALALTRQSGPGGPVANNSFDYFHPLNQLPVFLVGVLLFQWHRRAPSGHRHQGVATALFGGLALLATAALWRSGWPQAFAVLPTTAGLAFAALAHAARRSAWQPAVLCAIGRRSYAIYVVHMLFAWHALRAVDAGFALAGDAVYVLSLAAVGVASCIVAEVLMRGIEQPGIALGRALLAALPLQRPAAPAPARP